MKWISLTAEGANSNGAGGERLTTANPTAMAAITHAAITHGSARLFRGTAGAIPRSNLGMYEPAGTSTRTTASSAATNVLGERPKTSVAMLNSVSCSSCP
jgi:hypothetical protein